MKKKLTLLLSAAILLLTSCGNSLPAGKDPTILIPITETVQTEVGIDTEMPSNEFDPSLIPVYAGSAYTTVNDNIPFFAADDTLPDGYEFYSHLDEFGRCGPAMALVGKETMPTEERGEIGMIKPTGWHTVKYSGIVDGNYLYNRCHLIGYQLSGENANEKNLITGTRYFNVTGMLPFENEVADYAKNTGNHVMYRVTPVFTGDNLVADGVLMEAYSPEDNGEGVCFCVFVYNVQPGIEIDYATGDSWISEAAQKENDNKTDDSVVDYVLNTGTHKFHLPDCDSVTDMKQQNRKDYSGSRQDLIDQGYDPCKRCNPQEENMEYATYQITSEIYGEGTFFFTDCGHKMYSNKDKMAYHGCLCPGCFSQGKMTTLYLRGSEEGNRYWKKRLEEKL